jgi:hypothetical protein
VATSSERVSKPLRIVGLGSEVVRVADLFRVEESPDHEDECRKAGERVAAAA